MRRVLILTLFLVSFTTRAKQPNQLHLLRVAVGDFYPYVTCKDGEAKGINVYLVEKAFKAVNVQLEYTCMPWSRVYKSLYRNRQDISFPYLKSSERRNQLYYLKTPLMVTRLVFFHLETMTMPNHEISLKDISDLKLGGVLGYEYGQLIKQYDQKFGLYRSASSQDGFNRLLKDRIDILVEEQNVGEAIIASLPMSQREAITFTPFTETREDTNNYIVTGANNPNKARIDELYEKGLRLLNEQKPQ
ncbi:substrate-binding periplasmic protein [Vibrio marisflavi]|uniref:Solute-binding protein family 3/N-terminal domain-containing protein n=1 Tax=Vibrio marisflavi CECT 7928 TaxID=634439 RepID=A0ABN8DZM9_9VIBR|nr:transporter substrate-binding domain-containing protein [Vibrio marisflavi]CAH0536002.1 hypothetical protein VMF7928_00098 [Vibrio marisflavi CECT 7928]